MGNLKYNPLIYGKNQIENIVSIELQDGCAEIFLEDSKGIKTEVIPTKYNWILSYKPLDSSWIKLKGDLHYCWGKQYESKREFLTDRSRYKNQDIFSIYNEKEAFMINKGVTYFKGMKYTDVSVLAFDIEATTLEHDDKAKVLLIANTFCKNGKIERKLFAYDQYKNDAKFFDAWCSWVREINPSVITGHNIVIYDLPYLYFCASKAGTTLDLGRDGSSIRFNIYDSKLRKDGSQFYTYRKCHIYGREIIDTFFLALKYDVARNYESYSLKQIIKQENMEVKDRQFYDAFQIRNNYKIFSEWNKIKKYAEHDGDDALALYNLMIPSFFYLTQHIPKPFQLMIESAAGSQINAFLIRSYLQDSHSIPKSTPTYKFEGAISLGNPGIYHHAMKVDISSLYPNIILTYDLYDVKKDPNQNFLKAAQYFTEERLKNKKLANETNERYYRDIEQSQKIVINSFYGFMAADGLNFNSPSNAEFITKKGREILQKTIDWVNNNKYTLINADTDSVTICNGGGLDELQQQEILNNINSLFPKSIRFTHDGYFQHVLVVKAKNYVLDTGDKLKIKGSALKATHKEKAIQDFIKEFIQALLSNKTEELISIYHNYIKECTNITDIKRWTSKKTITSKVLNPHRTNEAKILAAIEEDGDTHQEGDKIKVYFDVNGNLRQEEFWNNNHDPYRLMEKLFKTVKIFENVLDKSLFINYSLKTKRTLLTQI